MGSIDVNVIYVIAGIMLCFAALSAAIGISLIGLKFLEGAARQPDLINMLRGQFFIVMGMVDVIPMITVGLALYFIFVVAG